ncbi:hypothetical protein ADS31_07035 [Brucella melitensis]|nr:hypothetical protein ADS31_07035 [Brucella melitensis]
MRAEERGADRHVTLFAETAGCLQRFDFAVAVETIAGFYLDGGDAFGNQRIKTRQGFAHQIVFACRAQVPDR